MFVFETSLNAEAAHVYDERELDNGVAARRTIKMLGCGACDLAKVDVCKVKDDLESRAETAETNASAYEQLDMITSAPSWLNAARINLTGHTAAELQEKTKDAEAAKAFVAEGGLNAFLAETTNSFAGVFTKQDLPELKNAAAIDDKEELLGTKITTKNGDIFTVIDASEAVGFAGETPDDLSYGVLTGKLLNRMRERDQRDQPQILNEDFKMQKTLATGMPSAPLTEIRMASKNRLYCTITPDAESGETRIIILGAHGGDTKTQNEFIAHATRPS